MKLNILAATAILAAAAIPSIAVAQSRSAYFTDNYTYRFQLNPAFAPEDNFVSMPGIGNLNIGLNGNVNLKEFIYNVNTADGSRTATFMHPSVDASTFISGIKDHSRTGLNTRIGVLAGGFRAFGGYNTISLNAVANAQIRAPRAIFSFLKEGVKNQTYDITNFDIHADTYAEIALTHSRDINRQWRVGAAVKLLLGFGNLDLNLHQATLSLTDDNWTAQTNADVHANYKQLAYKTTTNRYTGNVYINDVDFPGYTGVNGLGLAFDLGAQFTLNPSWQFSAAVTDLGFITWYDDMVASTNGTHTFASDDYVIDTKDFDDTWQPIRDQLTTLYELYDQGNQGSRTRALAATINLGAQFTLPSYRALSFGLLNTTRIYGRLSSTDFRLSANIRPVSCFSAAINYGIGTYGSAFGWILNYSHTGFNFFLGMDNTLGRLAKQGVPLTSNAQLSLGMNFPF
jgi:hypothetical protein